jgi:hypothetical protein
MCPTMCPKCPMCPFLCPPGTTKRNEKPRMHGLSCSTANQGDRLITCQTLVRIQVGAWENNCSRPFGSAAGACLRHVPSIFSMCPWPVTDERRGTCSSRSARAAASGSRRCASTPPDGPDGCSVRRGRRRASDRPRGVAPFGARRTALRPKGHLTPKLRDQISNEKQALSAPARSIHSSSSNHILVPAREAVRLRDKNRGPGHGPRGSLK